MFVQDLNTAIDYIEEMIGDTETIDVEGVAEDLLIDADGVWENVPNVDQNRFWEIVRRHDEVDGFI